MFWKILRGRRLITVALIVIVTIFFVVTYKAVYMSFEQKQITKEYYKISNNKNVGYLSMGTLNESYEEVYSELSQVDGIYLSNYNIDFLSDGHSKGIKTDKYFYDTFIKGNISEGRDLELSDFVQYAEEDMTIPVIIGPEIAQEYKVGIDDTYDATCYECVQKGKKTSEMFSSGQYVEGAYVGSDQVDDANEDDFINVEYKVIGIFDEGLKVPTVYNEDESGINTLNDAVVMPFVIDEISLTSDQKKNYEQGLFAYPSINVDVIFDQEDIGEREVLEEISNLEKEYGISIDYISIVDNLLMVQSEMGEYVEIMNATIFFILILSIIGVSLLLYKDLKSKKQVYIVYIINGSSRILVFKQQLYYLLLIQLISNVLFLIWMIISLDYSFVFKVFAVVNVLYLLMGVAITSIMYVYFRNKSIRNVLSEVEKDD